MRPDDSVQAQRWLGPTVIAPTTVALATVVLTGSATNPFLERE